MTIISRLDRVMVDRKISVIDLANEVGIAPNNISRIRTGKFRAVRLATLDSLCTALSCQPGDLFEFVPDDDQTSTSDRA